MPIVVFVILIALDVRDLAFSSQLLSWAQQWVLTHVQNSARPDGPTMMAKAYLLLGVLLSLTNDMPVHIWADLLPGWSSSAALVSLKRLSSCCRSRWLRVLAGELDRFTPPPLLASLALFLSFYPVRVFAEHGRVHLDHCLSNPGLLLFSKLVRELSITHNVFFLIFSIAYLGHF